MCLFKDRETDQEKDFSTRLMAFTFFYAIGIYLLFLGFHFWDKHLDYKGE